MLSRTYRLILLALCSLTLTAVSCGKDPQSFTTPLQGVGTLPGTVSGTPSGGTTGGTPTGGTGSSQQSGEATAYDLDTEAPLGLNPEYQVELFGGEATQQPLRGTSVVAGPINPPSGFAIIDLTMAKDGVAPNWDLQKGSFYEGEKVDLWIKYDLYSPSMTFERHWDSADIKLNFREFNINHTKGQYNVKLDWAIPFGSAKTNAIFRYDLTGNGINKVSPDFPFDILTPAGTTAQPYPQGNDGDTSVPGYGSGWAQMVAEDLLTNSDFDYNDFVGRLQSTEYRNSAGDLLQIKMRIKAIARGAGYDAAWQLNFGAAFPGSTAWATVTQFYANGTQHGNQRLWKSTDGVSIPVFTPLRGALPEPPGHFATNTVAGTKYVDGDYVDIVIFFNSPVKAGTYTPAPYKPELRVQPSGGGAPYTVSWWNKPGDMTDLQGTPLAFTVPDTFAWPLEFQGIWNIYPQFTQWIQWLYSPNAGNTNDPNTYMLGSSSSSAPATGESTFGSEPENRAWWQTGTGQDVFHAANPSGQLSTLNLIKYLNGDGTQTNASISKTVLNPLKASKTYYSSLPLPTSSINDTNNTSTAYTRVKAYLAGVKSNSEAEYQLGGELVTLVLNVERGLVKPNEWIYIPELNEIRPIAVDPTVSSKTSIIAAANAAFALPSSTANNNVKTMWKNICQRINAETYFVQGQPRPKPTPHWYDYAPTGNYFRRSLFTN
jgi:hypothetical protein